MSNLEKCPPCTLGECAGNDDGHCICLTDNRFRKPCPFYKTREQVAEEEAYCEQRLEDITKGEVKVC